MGNEKRLKLRDENHRMGWMRVYFIENSEVVYYVYAYSFRVKHKRLKKKGHNGYHGAVMNRVPIESTLQRFVRPATIDGIDMDFNELELVLRSQSRASDCLVFNFQDHKR